jgi:hypothetical protein
MPPKKGSKKPPAKKTKTEKEEVEEIVALNVPLDKCLDLHTRFDFSFVLFFLLFPQKFLADFPFTPKTVIMLKNSILVTNNIMFGLLILGKQHQSKSLIYKRVQLMIKELNFKKLVIFLFGFFFSFLSLPFISSILLSSNKSGIGMGPETTLYCDGKPAYSLPELKQTLFNTVVDLALEALPLPTEGPKQQLEKV